MESNVERLPVPQGSIPKVVVLDESLREYGLAAGATVEILQQTSEWALPVWDFKGRLQARFLRDEELGWKTAFTAFGYAGQICYFINPLDARYIIALGYLAIPRSTDVDDTDHRLLGRDGGQLDHRHMPGFKPCEPNA